MDNTKSQMPFWKKTLYIFLLLIFLVIGANIWAWDVSIFLSIIISIISIAMINFFWGELRGKKESMEDKETEETKQ